MKKNISLIILSICALGLIYSCSKELDVIAPTTGTGGFAFLKIAHFSPNLRTVLSGRDSFNVYVGGTTLAPGTKLNGAFLTYGSIFPTTTNLYAAIPAGTQFVRITVNGVTTPDSITLGNFSKTFNAGSYYSYILTDSIKNASEAKQIFIEDKFAPTDTSHYTIRFVHAILNDTTGKTVDVYSTRLAANMFTNVSPGTVTDFTTQPYNLLTDTLIIRRSGLPLELARLNAAVLAREHAYTLVYKGLPASTAGTKGRSITFYTNL